MTYELHHSDCIAFMRTLPDNHVDAIVTDPPYELGFMGKGWDKSGIANSVEMWKEALRILKPGGHLLAFSGSRTYHRMTCAIEDAGFEVRDQIMWLYGSGFPKSHDVSKAIDREEGAERDVVGQARRNMMTNGKNTYGKWDESGEYNITAPATDAAKQWQGWGTALKPAHEPICVARKPLIGTVAQNVLTWGTGGVNVDGCRVGEEGGTTRNGLGDRPEGDSVGFRVGHSIQQLNSGRWPANIIHDGSDEAVDGMGEASRFFYCAKASKRDRDEGCEGMEEKARPTMGSGIGGQPDKQRVNSRNHHPTVKPTDLMRYLCRLVTPPNGLVFDPFTGSGSTGKAAILEGFRFLGCDMTAEYIDIARARIEHAITQQQSRLQL